MIDRELLKKGIKELGFETDGKVCELFDLYAERLAETNRHINLTAITDPKKILTDHFLDSLIALKPFMPKKGDRILDLGTGAGFPGVPIAVMCPYSDVVMMDSTGKKINFVKQTCEALGIKNVSFVTGRGEEEAHRKEMREKFDFVYARAVSRLKILEEICLPFLKKGGKFIALKSSECEEEVRECLNTVSVFGGKIRKTEFCSIPFTDIKRALAITEKVSPTPHKYPRSYAEIIKK